MATAINDFIQGIIMIVGIVLVIFSVLKVNGGFMGSVAALAEVPGDFSGSFVSFFGPDPVSLFSVVILTSLGTWGLPQMIHKFYTIKSENAISKGAIISTIFAVVVAGGCYFLGGFGRLFGDMLNVGANGIPAEGYDAIIPVMMSFLPDALLGIVVILVLSASMSTLSSLVLTSSATLTLDVVKECFAKKMNDKKQVFIMRLFVLIFILISALIAIVQYKGGITFIAQLMGISWGALAGAFLAPFLLGLYVKRISKAAVWTSFIFGTGVMTLNMIAKTLFPVWLQSPINCGAFVMIAGLILVPLVSLFTKAPEKALVENAFSCYEKKVTTTAKDSLGME